MKESPLIRNLMDGLAQVKADDKERERAMNDVLDELAYIRAQLEEVLRRLPEARCAYCGNPWSAHASGISDHEFIA